MTIRYLPPAQSALRRHRAEAKRIVAKIEQFAANPSTLANNVKRLKGDSGLLRMRVGDFRVFMTFEGEDLVVTNIGPRGSIYD